MFLTLLIQIIDQGVRMQENAISFPFDEFYLWKGERGSFSQFVKIIATIASQMDTKKSNSSTNFRSLKAKLILFHKCIFQKKS